jgi:hypothetical protein
MRTSDAGVDSGGSAAAVAVVVAVARTRIVFLGPFCASVLESLNLFRYSVVSTPSLLDSSGVCWYKTTLSSLNLVFRTLGRQLGSRKCRMGSRGLYM